jgi:hypothetical protein
MYEIEAVGETRAIGIGKRSAIARQVVRQHIAQGATLDQRGKIAGACQA